MLRSQRKRCGICMSTLPPGNVFISIGKMQNGNISRSDGSFKQRCSFVLLPTHLLFTLSCTHCLCHICCRMTKEVRYHDDESEEDSESITKQKRVNERQTKKSKKKRSRPTGKGPRERERERERARERARSISGPPKSHRAKKNGRKTLARGMPRLAQQRHRGNGIPSSGSVRRRPGAKDTRTRKTVSSPERPRRQSPNKSRFDGSRKTAKERTRWQRYEPGDHDDHVKHQDRNGRQGQQRDNDHNRRRSQEQGQRRQRSTSRQRTGRRMERPR